MKARIYELACRAVPYCCLENIGAALATLLLHFLGSFK